MESPVVVDKPPEYHGNPSERGFPFDEEEGSSAWSELAARHPDIAARLRARPAPASTAANAPPASHQPHAAWARKRRPASQDGVDDFGSGFDHFDRFPFEDIPSEFREHFPSHWNRRFGPRDEPPPPPAPQPRASPPHQQPPAPPQQQSTSTQTEAPEPVAEPPQSLPQYGLRNTVDLGQKSPADPSLVDVDGRNQRCMSAPPDSRLPDRSSAAKMSGPSHPPEHEHAHSNVRHIPIFVEGRDEPVINKNVDHGAHDAKHAHVPPPADRDPYYDERDGPAGFQHPPNFSRPFGAPFNRQGFRQGPQPFVQQKVYPQTAFARANSPQRSQSPKPQAHAEDHFVKVPVHHEQSAPKTDHAPSRAQQPPRPPPQQASRAQTPPRQTQSPQPPPPPPPPQQPTAGNDPISVILSIQTDVLNLMTEVENFKGTKKDKKFMFLDEMLTRNLIKLDNIETDGKENVRQARREAIKCIQKCIAVLEAKADSNAASGAVPAADVEMNDNGAAKASHNGEVSQEPATKEPEETEQQAAAAPPPADDRNEPQPGNKESEVQQSATDNAEVQEPEQPKPTENDDQSPKPAKGASKGAKKRDKSKDKKDASVSAEKMNVDEKGDKATDSQTMDVEGAAAPSQ